MFYDVIYASHLVSFNQLLKASSHKLLLVVMWTIYWAVVVAQVVERWHSVWHGGSNPGMGLGFFSSELMSIYYYWVLSFFLLMCNRTLHTLPSSFLFPIIIYH